METGARKDLRSVQDIVIYIYIKPQSQPPMKRPTSLPKHILDSQKIISRQDTRTIKRRLIPTANVISLS